MHPSCTFAKIDGARTENAREFFLIAEYPNERSITRPMAQLNEFPKRQAESTESKAREALTLRSQVEVYGVRQTRQGTKRYSGTISVGSSPCA
jgi:hypothetical protein